MKAYEKIPFMKYLKKRVLLHDEYVQAEWNKDNHIDAFKDAREKLNLYKPIMKVIS